MNTTLKQARRAVMTDLRAICSHRSMVSTVTLEKKVAQPLVKLYLMLCSNIRYNKNESLSATYFPFNPV